MYFSKTWTENLSGSPEKHPPSPHGSTRVLACFVRSELRAAGKRTINVPISWSVRPSVLLGKPREARMRACHFDDQPISA